jgi:hypothetical protein
VRKDLAQGIHGTLFYQLAIALGFCGWSITSQVHNEWLRGQPISGGLTWPTIAALDVGIAVALLGLRFYYPEEYRKLAPDVR